MWALPRRERAVAQEHRLPLRSYGNRPCQAAVGTDVLARHLPIERAVGVHLT